jgi:hypothetical protein
MVIQSLGENSFRIDSGERSILVNPPSGRFKGGVTLLTETEVKEIGSGFGDAPSDEGVVIKLPGEYEVGGIEIVGVATPDSNEKISKIAYLVSWDDLKIVIFASSAIPEAERLEDLDGPDVMLLSTANLEGEKARELVKKLEPKIVGVLAHGKVKEFLSALGQKGESMEKFVFKRKDIDNEKGRAIILSMP